MFEILEDQMEIDEQRATTKRERVIRWAVVAGLSVILFSALYFGYSSSTGKLAEDREQMLFHELARYFESLENSPGRSKTYAVLGDVFKRASTSEISAIAYLCEGRVVPAFAGLEIGMGEQMLVRAIAAASSRSTSLPHLK